MAAFFAVPIAAIIQAFLATYSRQYDIIESDLTRVDTPNDPPDPPRPGVRVCRSRLAIRTQLLAACFTANRPRNGVKPLPLT